MPQGTELQSSFLRQLLVLAARPSMRLDGLLQPILEKALAVTSSDVGGAILIFEPSGQERLLASALRGELAGRGGSLLRIWKEDSRSPAFIVVQSGEPYCIDDHAQAPAHFPLLAGSRSSLWVPLLEEKKVIGLLHVASPECGHYSRLHLHQLQVLATEAVLATQRLLLREEMARTGASIDMVGVSEPFLELEHQIKLAATYARGPVLLTGERGSGKELAARAIHAWSDRRDKPFVPVLASALTESLFTDELFGHERGSFTGATRERPGKFQAAGGGTIFFDEIADMSPQVQSSLLRVLERGELQRVGRDKPLRVDVHVIAATNRNLPELIAQGRFREDLYDRLNVFEIKVPPLRERHEDIPLLASHFLRKHCQGTWRPAALGGICTACKQAELTVATGTECIFTEQVGCTTAEFYEALQAYDWPGNVCELESLVMRLLSFVPVKILDAKHVRQQIQEQPVKAAVPEAEDLTLDTAIRNYIQRVLRRTNYNQSQAARFLGIPLTTLQSKIKKLGIEIKKGEKG